MVPAMPAGCLFPGSGNGIRVLEGTSYGRVTKRGAALAYTVECSLEPCHMVCHLFLTLAGCGVPTSNIFITSVSPETDKRKRTKEK